MSTVKLLVVDDETDLEHLIRQKFRRHMREGEYAFSFAQDGVGALESLHGDPEIDIVLTDINMPRMDGLTLLSRLSEYDRTLMTIVISAYGDMDNIRVAMNRGSFDFLTKPIDLQDLEITVAKAAEFIRRKRAEQHVREIFGRYLSQELIDEVLAQPGEIRLGGESRVVTLLMSDLRGFSTISERLEPERVVELLNLYLGRMVEVIAEFDGVIDNFVGDGILVLFGAPIQRENDAVRAVACALSMQTEMTSVNSELAGRGLPKIEMGIGVNTGRVVVGNIGSRRRMKYSVVGNHVNLVSRIESYTVGGQVLVSDATCDAIGDGLKLQRDFSISAKGFSDPIAVRDVVGLRYGTVDLNLANVHQKPVKLEVPIACKVQLVDGKVVDEATHETTITDLSVDFARVLTDEPLERFANVVLWLSQTGEVRETGEEGGKRLEGLNLSAKVVDLDGDGSAVVQFLGLSAQQREYIQAAVARAT